MTSDTTELLPLRARVSMAGGGHCIMSGFPGLESGIDGAAWIAPEMLEATLAEMRRQGAVRLLVLTEESELPTGAFDLLRAALSRHELQADFLPIRDFHAPEAAFLVPWQSLGPQWHAMHRAGQTTAVCCQYGAGRSGLVAALLLIEAGTPPLQAIHRVREAFSEAIESTVQYDWLLARPDGTSRED